MKLKVQPTKSQLADLKRLAEAMSSAGAVGGLISGCTVGGIGPNFFG